MASDDFIRQSAIISRMCFAVAYLPIQFIEPLIEQLEHVSYSTLDIIAFTSLLFMPIGLFQSQVACTPCGHRIRSKYDLLQPLQCSTLCTTTSTTRLQIFVRRSIRSSNSRISHSLRTLSMWIHSSQQR